MLKGKLIGGYVKDLLCSHYLFFYLKYIRKSEFFEAVSRETISHLSYFIFSKFCFFFKFIYIQIKLTFDLKEVKYRYTLRCYMSLIRIILYSHVRDVSDHNIAKMFIFSTLSRASALSALIAKRN